MKIGINGFGRIGRAVFRIALENKIEVVAINDLHGIEDAAYLLKYDSVYGKYDKKVEVKGGDLIVAGKKVKVFSESKPEKIPWKRAGVDVVVESTGVFREVAKARGHLKAGAKKVLISAPCKGPGLIIVPGVNDYELTKRDDVISVASCTTNCLAPIVKVLDEKFGIISGHMTTVHAYTSSQMLVDGNHKDKRRGRAAAENIIPTTTGASIAVEQVYPKLKGKLSGVSIRVPVPSGSIVDFVAKLDKKATVEEVNKEFEKMANKGMKGIIEYSVEPLVSKDIIGNSHSAIVDSENTRIQGDLVKVFAWYDNEFGYSNRMVDLIKTLKKWVK